MTSDMVFTLALVILLILHEIIVERMRQEAKEERQLLMDRIQAKDLPEFKALNTAPKEKKKPETEEKLRQI